MGKLHPTPHLNQDFGEEFRKKKKTQIELEEDIRELLFGKIVTKRLGVEDRKLILHSSDHKFDWINLQYIF